ncbi:MAG: O-antigen ligase family protein [Eudoraea sp.]|uniref:O-antigen ligase family protein n=1 Tax=Eudoraea sp. TaxID=1979955 RepID=UPI0032668594
MSIREILKISTNILVILFLGFTILPVKLNYSSMVIIGLLVIALCHLFYNGLRTIPNKYFVLVLTVPLLIYSLGLFNTQNLSSGLSFITRNLSFIAFPVIFLSLGKFVKKSLVFNSFLIFVVIIDLYLTYLFIYYFNFGERFYMIVQNEIYHSTYLGMFNLLAFWISILTYKKNKSKLLAVFAIFFIISSILTASRIVFLLSFVSLVISILLLVESRTKRIFLVFATVIITLTALFSSPGLKQKFKQIEEINKIGFDKDNYESISSRFGMLEASTKIIKRSPLFGTGTGDLTDELVLEYKRMNFTMGYKYRYNPHNQILSNLARNGFLGGSICIISIFIFPAYISIMKRDVLLFAFIGVIFGVGLTESILDVHKGITFYTFFSNLLIYSLISESKTEKR